MRFKYITQPIRVFTFILLLTLGNNTLAQEPTKNLSGRAFVEVFKDFPNDEKNLRKWENAIVADLDRDGFLDLLINDHGFSVSVCWNNKGRFAKPYNIIMGDMHGISVGDLNKDGDLEVIISRGGGSGTNARNSKIYRVNKNRELIALDDFHIPLELMRGRTVKFMDGDNDGDLDLLEFAFPAAEKNGISENYIYKNDGTGELVLSSSLPSIKTDGQKTLLTDFNGDNTLDILMYGHGKVKAFKGNGDLTYSEVSNDILPYGIEDVTGIIELDYDNDGDFDLFFTRGKEFLKGETFFDEQTQLWAFFTKRGKFEFNDLEVGDVLKIENLQSQWPYKSLFVGESGYEYEFPGETHSGRDIRLVNSDALGFPDNRTEKGTNIGYIGNRKWRFAIDLWAPSTGVIHGVKSYPKYDHEKGLSSLLLENRNGNFMEVTKEAGLYFEEHTTSSATADFDNNGFQDIIIMRRGDLIHKNEAMIFLNLGNSKFEELKMHNVVTNDLGSIGQSVETFDYNLDGREDVVLGNERGKWHLFKNSIVNNSKHLTIEVGNSNTGKATAQGALVLLSHCGNKQVKRIGATGAPYSLNFNNLVHFGLGSCESQLKIKVTWSNGETQERKVKAVADRILIGKKIQ